MRYSLAVVCACLFMVSTGCGSADTDDSGGVLAAVDATADIGESSGDVVSASDVPDAPSPDTATSVDTVATPDAAAVEDSAASPEPDV